MPPEVVEEASDQRPVMSARLTCLMGVRCCQQAAFVTCVHLLGKLLKDVWGLHVAFVGVAGWVHLPRLLQVLIALLGWQLAAAPQEAPHAGMMLQCHELDPADGSIATDVNALENS